MQDNQTKLTKLYSRVNEDMQALGIAKSLRLLCSIELDKDGNQVNLTARPQLTYKAKRHLRISFDEHANELSLIMNYVNLPE